MKKIMTSILLVVLSMTAFFGCSKNDVVTEGDADTSSTKKVSIVTTIFPPYDFSRQIAGELANVKMLLKPGSESHSYEPTPADIKEIQNCDIFICTGGENETWVDSILESFDSSSIKVIRMIDCVEAVEEEMVEGMQEEHDHAEEESHSEEEHDHAEEESHGEEEHDEEEVEYDEHVWTSPMNAVTIVKTITDAIIAADSTNESVYQLNSDAYIEKLNQLDRDLKDVVANASRTDIVVGDRFPFRYLTEAYGIHYRAAFPGCSTDTEPSAATISYLIDYVKENQIPVVFTIEFSNGKVADAICEESSAKRLQLHSCHNVSKDELEAGVTYIDLMESNVANLKEALQ